MTSTKERKLQLNTEFNLIIKFLEHKLRKIEAEDIPESIVYESINALEYLVDPSDRKILAKRLIDRFEMPDKARGQLRKYFCIFS